MGRAGGGKSFIMIMDLVDAGTLGSCGGFTRRTKSDCRSFGRAAMRVRRPYCLPWSRLRAYSPCKDHDDELCRRAEVSDCVHALRTRVIATAA